MQNMKIIPKSLMAQYVQLLLSHFLPALSVPQYRCPLGVLCACMPARSDVAACHCSREGLAQQAFITCFSNASLSVGERPRNIQEKQQGKERGGPFSQQRGTDSWCRYKYLPPTVPQSSHLATFSVLVKGILNEPVSAFILICYLRVKSSAELQKCE